MTTEIKVRPECFAAVEKATTNAERLEIHLADFVHVTGLPGVPTPSREVWGTVTTFPNPHTTILVTPGGEVWVSLRKAGESDRSYNHVVKILAPNGSRHLLWPPAHSFPLSELRVWDLLRRVSSPDYDPADPNS